MLMVRCAASADRRKYQSAVSLVMSSSTRVRCAEARCDRSACRLSNRSHSRATFLGMSHQRGDCDLVEGVAGGGSLGLSSGCSRCGTLVVVAGRRVENGISYIPPCNTARAVCGGSRGRGLPGDSVQRKSSRGGIESMLSLSRPAGAVEAKSSEAVCARLRSSDQGNARSVIDDARHTGAGSPLPAPSLSTPRCDRTHKRRSPASSLTSSLRTTSFLHATGDASCRVSCGGRPRDRRAEGKATCRRIVTPRYPSEETHPPFKFAALATPCK